MALSDPLSPPALCSWLTSSSSSSSLRPRPPRHATPPDATPPPRSAPSARRSSPSKAPSLPPTYGRAQDSRTSNARLARTSSSRQNLATRPTHPRPPPPHKPQLPKYPMGKGNEERKPPPPPPLQRGRSTSQGEREAQSRNAKSARPSSPDQVQSSAKVRLPNTLPRVSLQKPHSCPPLPLARLRLQER